MTKKTWNTILFIGILVVYGIGCMYLGVVLTEKRTVLQYFVNNSEKHLNGLKLDIPDEISELSTLKDTTIDLLAAYIDTVDNTISLGFSGKAMLKDTYITIPEHSKITINSDHDGNTSVFGSDSLVRTKFQPKK